MSHAPRITLLSTEVILNDYWIIVTGLPASGKTTIGREVAKRLEIPFLDKDDYLEQLYEDRGIGDRAWRTKLSLESNDLFQTDAVACPQVVLVSHWRPKTMAGPSGTPIDWLLDSYQTVIELYCACPVEVAANRFKSRKRHPGHLDGDRELNKVVEWMKGYHAHLPVGIGRQLAVNSGGDVAYGEIIAEIKVLLSAGGSKNDSV